MTQFANHEPGCDGSVTVPDAGFGGQDMTYECEHPSHRAACWTESGAHLFVKESDGAFVCQVCGDVRGRS